MSLNSKLLNIQQELKAEKSLHNKFGGFNYRSAETILEALKQHLKKHELILTMSDEVIAIGDRVYVRSTARLVTTGEEAEQVGEVHGWAREQLEKKGMDASQITGAASSYARKYALCGLFAIDDGRDADSQDNSTQASETAQEQSMGSQDFPATTKQKAFMLKLWAEITEDDDFQQWYKAEYNEEASAMTSERASEVIDRLKEKNV
jgi:hypothetical protein